MQVRLLAAVALGLAMFSADAFAQPKEIRVADRVFLVRDKEGTPTEFQMIVNAGSADEPGGVSRGIAHYLEHLILVGRNAQNADIALRFLPDARSNGWTNQRATGYTHSVPARKEGPRETLEKLFSFYAARLRDFEVSPEDAVRERNVVLQEHDWRLGSSAAARFSRRLDLALFDKHPLGHWPIGPREEIAKLQVEDAKAFHGAWYHINNVWFVIKADIDPDDLRQLANKYLADAMPKPLPPRASANEIDRTPRFEQLSEKDAQSEAPRVTYRKLFRFEESSEFAGRAVANVLSNLLSTQLPQSLHDVVVEQKKLSYTTPGISISRMGDQTYQLSISAQPASGIAPSVLIEALSDYVSGLSSVEFSERNIGRIKGRIEDSRASVDGDPARVYSRLASWLAAGFPYEELSAYPARVKAVTAADIRSLAIAAASGGRVVTGILSAQEQGQ
jgi:zinc protease